jgi:Cu+-exporting ATPase
MTKDPVCGMQVDENKAAATSSYQGKKYSFCGQECKNKFDSEPQRYAQQQGKQQGKQQPHQPEHANR